MNQNKYLLVLKNQIIAIDEDHRARIIINGHNGEVWGLCTHPTEHIYATGAHDTCIKL